MSITLDPLNSDNNKKNKLIAIVEGGKYDGIPIYASDDNEQGQDNCRVLDRKREKFQQYPSDRVFFITGPSGSGKSVYTAKLANIYIEDNPNCQCYVFSMLDEDPSIDSIPNIRRVNIDSSLIDEPISKDDFNDGDLVIFDDIEVITDKNLQKAIDNLKDILLQLGRHGGITLIITSHLANKGKQTKIVMSELQSLTIFPKFANKYQTNYLLKEYIGLNQKQATKIFQSKSRWLTILTRVPQIIIEEDNITMLNAY